VPVPVVARLAGTNMQQGRAILRESGLRIITADTLADAASKAVAALSQHSADGPALVTSATRGAA